MVWDGSAVAKWSRSHFSPASWSLDGLDADLLGNVLQDQQRSENGHLRQLCRPAAQFAMPGKLGADLLQQCNHGDGLMLVAPGLEPDGVNMIRWRVRADTVRRIGPSPCGG